MNRKRLYGMVMTTAYLATVIACVGIDPEHCYDCGECGFVGGLNETDSLRMGSYGIDATNVPTLELITWQKGGCAGEPSTKVSVQYDAGKITSKPTPAGQKLDTSAVKDTTDKYDWTGRGITATTEELSDLSIRIAFTEGGTTVAVICTSTGGPANCVDEMP